ncbi:hypothetical protein DM01DRAFT_1338532 [Hesseltinella vesiculosa]|uniref:Uncharacterized protein n=1 Tax=Hesseltinella vesiculosa TaxID=101127 RepID=A0A1X2G9D8_9FUNG|nr:hypothetical protein DM01DRAFT_1338532 [Hesseltinella vesiculosa]
MVFPNGLFKKRKLRRKDTQRQCTADLDTTGILAQPFHPLKTRVTSPTDLLDMVGYPQPMNKLTVRNKTPPATRDLASSTVSLTTQPLHMPVPKKAMAPTRRILADDAHDKTLLMESDPREEINDLKQTVIALKRERETRHLQHLQQRQLEQDMMREIQQNHAKIDQLSQSLYHAASNPSFHSSTPSMDDYDDDDRDDDDDDQGEFVEEQQDPIVYDQPLLYTSMCWQDEMDYEDDDDDSDADGPLFMPSPQRQVFRHSPAMMTPLRHCHPMLSTVAHAPALPRYAYNQPMPYRRSVPPKIRYSCPSVYNPDFY